MNKNEVRVRMAPSPTGFFHVGSARTALYNWLFARHNNGKFILRVEDTDTARSSREMIQVILDGLSWLGMNWDEGPYFQSERLAIYQQYADRLLKSGSAYYCYCRPEDLAKEKNEAYKKKIDWQYDRRCLRLSETERAEKERQKIPRAIRFFVPDHAVEFEDMIHGSIKREAENIEDFIIMRPDHTPTYNFACAIDDHEMEITHVIRAVEHITNTPKQIVIYESLNLEKPKFGHLPLILGTDKKKLSKRHGAVSLMDYRDQGILAEAMVNFLALLGWSPGDGREIMKIDEIIQSFTLERINAANAVFDFTKLEWMNGQYIYRFTDEELLTRLRPHIIAQGLMRAEDLDQKRDWVLKICQIMKLRLKTLDDFGRLARFFFTDDFEYDETALQKHLTQENLDRIERFLVVLKASDPFSAPVLEQGLRGFAADNKLRAKDLIHPLRIFITGRETGPGLFETMEILGKESCIRRLDLARKKYRGVSG